MKKQEKSTFVKLTKKDGRLVWINASYVVTVEPARLGGTVVVPIGDGLDYEVREEPEEVLAMVTGAPVPPAVPVPVPPPVSLTASDLPAPQPSAAAEMAKKRRAARKAKSAVPEAGADAGHEPAVPDADAESVSAALAAEAEKSADADTDDTPEKLAEKKPVVRKKFEFPDEYLVRLRKLAPGSIRKLNNTLRSQFKIDDCEPVQMYLVDRGLVTIDGTHIVWHDDAASLIPENIVDLVLG